MSFHKTVLFICTANYYRSRFSEYLFNAWAEENGLRWRAGSRRISDLDGRERGADFGVYGLSLDGDGCAIRRGAFSAAAYPGRSGRGGSDYRPEGGGASRR